MRGFVLFLLLAAIPWGGAWGKPVIVFPVPGAVVHQPRGLVVGFSDQAELYEVTVRLNGVSHKVELWDGVFDIDLAWQPGKNLVSVEGSEVAFVYDSYAGLEERTSVHQAMLDNCANCHILGPNRDLTLVDAAGTLCLKCHVMERKGFEHRTVSCDVCHVPHTSRLRRLGRSGDANACRACHRQGKTGEDTPHQKDWVALDCVECHFQPTGNAICHSCHLRETVAPNQLHRAGANRVRCATCHLHHQAEAGTVVGACRHCHADEFKTRSPIHGQLVAEACEVCHVMHATSRAEARKSADRACQPCHGRLSEANHPKGLASCNPCHPLHHVQKPAIEPE